ncbi:MAG: hypothetical protein ACRBCK_07285 [Alphaproteobacteria bacterium]
MGIDKLSTLYKRASQGAEGDWKTILTNAIKIADGHPTRHEEDVEYARLHTQWSLTLAEQDPFILLSLQTEAGTQNVMPKTDAVIRTSPIRRMLSSRPYEDILKEYHDIRLPKRHEITQALLEQDKHQNEIHELWDNADQKKCLNEYLDNIVICKTVNERTPLDKIREQADETAYKQHIIFLSDLLEQYPEATTNVTDNTGQEAGHRMVLFSEIVSQKRGASGAYSALNKDMDTEHHTSLLSQIKQSITEDAQRYKEDLAQKPEQAQDASAPYTFEA